MYRFYPEGFKAVTDLSSGIESITNKICWTKSVLLSIGLEYNIFMRVVKVYILVNV